MSRKKQDPDKQPETSPTPEEPTPDTPPQDAEEQQAEAAQIVEQELKETLGVIEKERDELEERVKRIAADYQNFVRRSEQNIASAREQQLFEFARGLMTVLDHFDRALEVDPEKTSTKDLMAGVTMVHDELLRALNRFGIERLDVEKGEPFDPNRHEALMRQAVEGVETNHVTAQYQPGYVLKDKTIRPAQVGVAE